MENIADFTKHIYFLIKINFMCYYAIINSKLILDRVCTEKKVIIKKSELVSNECVTIVTKMRLKNRNGILRSNRLFII